MIIDFEKLKRYSYRKIKNGEVYCSKCGCQLDYCTLYENLQCVRCEDCESYTLVEIDDGYAAMSKTGEAYRRRR